MILLILCCDVTHSFENKYKDLYNWLHNVAKCAFLTKVRPRN